MFSTAAPSGCSDLQADDATEYTKRFPKLQAGFRPIAVFLIGSRSNPNAGERNSLAAKRLTNSGNPLSGNGQETGATNWLDLTSIDIQRRLVIDCWHLLCDEERQRMADMCGANDTDKIT